MPAESPRQQASIGPGSVSVRNPRLYLCPDTRPFWKKALPRSFRLYAKASRLACGGRGVDCNLAPQQSTPQCEPRAPGGACPYGRTREDDSHLRPHLPVSSDIKYEARAGRHLLVLTFGPLVCRDGACRRHPTSLQLVPNPPSWAQRIVSRQKDHTQ